MTAWKTKRGGTVTGGSDAPQRRHQIGAAACCVKLRQEAHTEKSHLEISKTGLVFFMHV